LISLLLIDLFMCFIIFLILFFCNFIHYHLLHLFS
jgi:hypothetical protein